MKNVRLGDHDIAEVSSGQAAPQNPQSFGASGYPFVRAGSLEHLCSGGAPSELEHIEPLVAKEHRLKLFPKDTVVFAKSGMSAKIGRVYRLQESAYVVSHLATITPKAKLDAAYLSYFLEANPPSRLIPNDAYPSIRLSEIENITINLPPLAEQRRIAAILDKADAIRRKRQQSLELADSLLKSVFLNMFGDPVTNPKGWDTLELCEVAEIISGVTKGKKYNGQQLVSVPYMRVANVQDGHILLNDIKYIDVTQAELQRYELAAGDILLTEGGDPDKLGRGAIWQGEVENCIHQNHIFRVRISAKNVIPDYLNALVGSQYGKHYFMQAAKQTTGIASINKTQLSKFPTQIPPLGLQNKFATIVQKVEAHKQRGMQGQQEADELFKALQQQFFS